MIIINHKVNGLRINQRRKDGYINLTQMAKVYGKRLDNWLRLKDTQDLLTEFEHQEKLNSSNVRSLKPALIVKRGKHNGGTWGHPDIAIQFAQWLDKRFALQVSRWVREWVTSEQNHISFQSMGISTDLLSELNELEDLITSMRSQSRIFHTGSHQPANDHLVKSLHTISHNQLNIINSTIQRLQRLKQVAEVNSGSKIEADIEIPSAQPKPNNQSSTNPTMKDLTAANFIDSIPIVTKEATVRFTVDLPESMHRDLSILAAKKSVSKADIVRMLLDDALEDINE